MGKLLLIFDGFDEMAARVNRQEMINNFWELAADFTQLAQAQSYIDAGATVLHLRITLGHPIFGVR